MSIEEAKNYDNIFIRSVIAGTISFLYDSIFIEIVKDGIPKPLKVPVFYSTNGSENYIKDVFIDNDKYFNELSCKVEGNIRSYPRGVLSIKNANIIKDELLNSDIRLTHYVREDNGFGKEDVSYSSRFDLIPLSFDFELKFKFNNENERFKLFDEFIDNFYKKRKFYINYKGVYKIPCQVMISEENDLSKQTEFSFDTPQEKLESSYKLNLITYKPKEKGDKFRSNTKLVKTNVTKRINGGD